MSAERQYGQACGASMWCQSVGIVELAKRVRVKVHPALNLQDLALKADISLWRRNSRTSECQNWNPKNRSTRICDS